jgi:hypothetical protein
MNPYAIIAALVLWGASIAGTGWWFYGSGQDSEKAKQADLKQAIQDTRDAAMKGAGDAIAAAKITNTTVQRVVETRTRVEPVYRDCKHTPGMRDTLNGALRGEPAGGGELPEAASSPR